MCKSQHYNTYCGNAYFNEMYLLTLVFILNQAKYVYTFMFVYTVHLRCVLQNLNEPGYLIFLQAFLKTGCATLPKIIIKSTSDENWTNYYLGNRSTQYRIRANKPTVVIIKPKALRWRFILFFQNLPKKAPKCGLFGQISGGLFEFCVCGGKSRVVVYWRGYSR